jgi:hypothetical protein
MRRLSNEPLQVSRWHPRTGVECLLYEELVAQRRRYLTLLADPQTAPESAAYFLGMMRVIDQLMRTRRVT